MENLLKSHSPDIILKASIYANPGAYLEGLLSLFEKLSSVSKSISQEELIDNFEKTKQIMKDLTESFVPVHLETVTVNVTAMTKETEEDDGKISMEKIPHLMAVIQEAVINSFWQRHENVLFTKECLFVKFEMPDNVQALAMTAEEFMERRNQNSEDNEENLEQKGDWDV